MICSLFAWKWNNNHEIYTLIYSAYTMSLHMLTLLSLKQQCWWETRPTAAPEWAFLSDKHGMRMRGENIMFYFKISSSVGPWPAGKLPIITFIKNTVHGHKSVIGLKYYL